MRIYTYWMNLYNAVMPNADHISSLLVLIPIMGLHTDVITVFGAFGSVSFGLAIASVAKARKDEERKRAIRPTAPVIATVGTVAISRSIYIVIRG